VSKDKNWALIENQFNQVSNIHNIPDAFFQKIKPFI